MHSQSDPAAHTRFRQRTSRSYWGGLMVAVLVHFALFAFAPGMSVAGMGGEVKAEVRVVDPVPEIPPPPEPPEIRPPSKPVIGDAVDPDVTIPAYTDFSDAPPAPPPPPVASGSERPFEFTPRDVEPTLKNTRDIQRLLERSYPPIVRDAGIGGVVTLWLYVDVEGNVRESRVQESSGIPSLDDAAVAVASAMRFRPAQYRGRSVPVWVAQRIEFTTKM
ncbi:MAG: TonB family protein [Longimicrobiales bacterium]